MMLILAAALMGALCLTNSLAERHVAVAVYMVGGFVMLAADQICARLDKLIEKGERDG